MRQVVLDTETTGLEPEQDHRIIEIGCVELINRRPTGNNYHQYIRPDRDIDEAAQEVHGITLESLADKPVFADIVHDFLEYVKNAELIIHNASFDVAFINHELTRVDPALGKIEDYCTIVDTLKIARNLHPGQPNSLDALCKRYNVDNTQRTLHGALLDAEILADVYLAMTGGQVTLFSDGTEIAPLDEQKTVRRRDPNRPPLPVVRADAEELAAHAARLDEIEKECGHATLWRRLEEQDAG